MADYLTRDEKFRGLIYGDNSRSRAGACRFGGADEKRVRLRTASPRLGGYLRGMIEAIANSKLRRMKHELELHGYAFDRPGENWEVFPPNEPSKRSK